MNNNLNNTVNEVHLLRSLSNMMHLADLSITTSSVGLTSIRLGEAE